MNKIINRMVYALCVLISVVVIQGCEKGEPIEGKNYSNISLVNPIAGAPKLDIFINNEKIGSLTENPVLKITESGNKKQLVLQKESGEKVVDTLLNLEAGKNYAYKFVYDGAALQFFLADNNTVEPKPDASHYKIRVINTLKEGSGKLNLYFYKLDINTFELSTVPFAEIKNVSRTQFSDYYLVEKLDNNLFWTLVKVEDAQSGTILADINLDLGLFGAYLSGLSPQENWVYNMYVYPSTDPSMPLNIDNIYIDK